MVASQGCSWEREDVIKACRGSRSGELLAAMGTETVEAQWVRGQRCVWKGRMGTGPENVTATTVSATGQLQHILRIGEK